MSIARLAVGSKAVLAAKSFTRAVSASQSYQAIVLNQGCPSVMPPRRQLSTSQPAYKEDTRTGGGNISDQWHLLRKAHKSELREFKELVTLTNQSPKYTMNDIKAAMDIYHRLKELNPFSKYEISSLIQGIHSSSRTGQKQLTHVISSMRGREKAKQSAELSQYMDQIAADVQSGVVSTNEFGMMQMLTSYLTMQTPEKGVEQWNKFLANESSSEACQLAKHPKVVGAVLDLMVAEGKPIEEIEKVYEWAKQQERPVGEKTNSFINLEHALNRAYIFYERIPDALRLFGTVIREYPKEDYYLARIHETFIGDCAQIEVAKTFYMEAMNQETPYQMTCHPSAAHRLMERCWAANKDVDELFDLWQRYLKTVPPSQRERMFNILSYSLLTHFFEANPAMTPEAYAYLKNIISAYSETRPKMSSIFLNTLLTMIPQWKNSEVTLGIIETYDLYKINKGNDAYRVILNALGSVEVEKTVIESVWNARVRISDPIQVYDWGALAKACDPADRHDLFEKMYTEAAGPISDREQKGLLSFLSRPQKGSTWAAEIVQNA